jgi:hypothetical protein
MALMDTIKKAMQGRSETVEKVIDGAVERLGRYSASLKKQGETVKDHARRLDETRREGPAPDGPPPAAAASDAPAIDLSEAPAAPPGQGLRGSLVAGPGTTPPSPPETPTPPA